MIMYRCVYLLHVHRTNVTYKAAVDGTAAAEGRFTITTTVNVRTAKQTDLSKETVFTTWDGFDYVFNQWPENRYTVQDGRDVGDRNL